MRDFLELNDIKSAFNTDAISALENIKNNKYKAIICDINMPKLKGTELLRKYRKFDTPFYFFTGHGGMLNLDELNGLFQQLFEKPDLNKLVNHIKEQHS